MPPGRPSDREISDILRRRVLFPINVPENLDTLVMNSTNRFTMQWWRDRLSGFKPSELRMTCRLPGHGAYGRLAAAYVKAIWEKLRLACRGLRSKNETAVAALRDLESLKNHLAHPRPGK
jgi:hypothetical protein